MSGQDFSNFSMFELFRIEADNQTKIMTSGLLELERKKMAPEELEILMRAAHSLKGAGRIVDLGAAVKVSHAMEDCFVAAQKGTLRLGPRHVDLLLSGVDLLSKISQTPEADTGLWEKEQKGEIDSFLTALAQLLASPEPEPETKAPAPVSTSVASAPAPFSEKEPSPPAPTPESTPAASPGTTSAPETDRVLRVTADHLNRLLGLAGESLVESHRLGPFAESLQRLKRQQGDLARMLEAFRETLSGKGMDEETEIRTKAMQDKVTDCRQLLLDRLEELELFDRRSTNLSHHLYEEALACRMRPFADGTHGFPRMIRDVARSLGKEVRFDIVGEATRVDRDMLEKLEAPLTHLLRNAVDHGLEFPDQRAQTGKPTEGTVRLEARHTAGMLQITVSDDGKGINFETLRDAIVRKKLTTADSAVKMSEAELLEFLFLPSFTMKESVTEISGRGVGLDAVQHMVKQVRGTVRIHSTPGQGTRFQLQLPLTLSVVRTLLVDIGGEPYAFPLAYITRTLKLPPSKIEALEGRQHFRFEGQPIGLVTAHQVLGFGAARAAGEDWPVVVVESRDRFYGVVVDHFLGERELVVHALDPRLGKIKDISAGALMEDGAPALIIDVEDLIQSIDKMISSGPLNKVVEDSTDRASKKGKRVLIVDDSLTVRELERKILDSHGYNVEVAVNGMDGWNAVRTGKFDLIIRDVDMPRMDGIELVTLMKRDPNTKSIPVMIISYKDREEDRQRGLEAGADYYLTKGSFQDEALLNAVRDLIGESGS
jgi:two-component system sensor histidine kinase and response regulator WspE